MLYAFLAVFAVLIVIADQITKYLTVANIPLHEIIPVWDGVFHLTYLRNTGMAFSLLEGGRWFFLVLTAAALALMVLAVVKKWIDHPVGLWSLAAIAGGAVGNLIDRVSLGYVIDMIEVEFIRFPVFNVADSFVVCGAIGLVIYTFFFDKPKKENADETDTGPIG
ncbi:MAG: signal peptidase II [Oscillospiraceae bacterium]|nr:signal peptidase II [Oscillospiraceae bacterium]